MTEFYTERTDRNIGWITREEQEILRSSIVGIAGCGGMGGLLAATLVRTGIGQVRIADIEDFDISNLNRQFGATRATLGHSKARVTAHSLREITQDADIVVFEEGITHATVGAFVSGCDIVCDEIEFWAIGARCILHEETERCGIPVQTCTSVGFGSRLVRFDHQGMRMRDMLGVSLNEACELESRLVTGIASIEEIDQVLQATLAAIAPRLPRYTALTSSYDDRSTCLVRMLSERRASIIGSNPPFATGFAANQVVLSILAQRGSPRDVALLPRAPGYVSIDSAFITAECVLRETMSDD